MPRFIGSRVRRPLHQTAFREVYEFNLLPPLDAGYGPKALIPAIVPLDTSPDEPASADSIPSCIAQELAEHFGATREGDTIELSLLEDLGDGTAHRFRLPVRARFAVPQRGPEYIQIGTRDLDAFFSIAKVPQGESDPCLTITLRPGSPRQCDELPLEPALASDR
jgi:hypothetical protein